METKYSKFIMTKSIENIRGELKEMITVSLEETFKKLFTYLKSQSLYYNQAVQLQGMLTKTTQDDSLGIQEQQTTEIEFNRIRLGLIRIIDALRPEDIGIKNTIKKGEILYAIPNEMVHNKTTKCLVRIAHRTEFLLENLELEQQPTIESIRLSKVMNVELMDVTNNFEITSVNSAEQYLEEDSFTEWKFYVMPKALGSFPLLLKVTTIQIINQKERKKDIVLEKLIKIVTQVQPRTVQYENAGEALVFANGEQRSDQSEKTEQPKSEPSRTQAEGYVQPPPPPPLPSEPTEYPGDSDDNIHREVDTSKLDEGKEIISKELEKSKRQLQKEITKTKKRIRSFLLRLVIYAVLGVAFIKFYLKKDVAEVLGELWQLLTTLLQSS